MNEQVRAALERARARLARLDWYPRPVRMKRVRIVVVPWFFKLPRFRQFDGFTAYFLILLRKPPGQASDELIVHELCHVWQMQHHPIHMPLSYLWRGYRKNAYELEARRAAVETRGAP